MSTDPHTAGQPPTDQAAPSPVNQPTEPPVNQPANQPGTPAGPDAPQGTGADTGTGAVGSAGRGGDADITSGPSPATAAAIVEMSRSMLRGGLWAALAVGVVVVIVAAVTAGVPALLAAVVGIGLAIAVSALGPLAMRWTATIDPFMVMAVALGVFVGKLVVLFVLFLVVDALALLDTQVFALAVGAGAIAYITGEVVAFARARPPALGV